ncbi:glycoprotein H [Rhinolophus gammaherpesvirus 1]|uniref:Glycoprotein H n=1 Tax=Rhinolophus gammaherpesvirus 1 TaxID=2054179 RepID=A0A2Z5U738_9GAMA|nr:glycoprotein H [Rhinolophus gammaherpesvirus 1]BBB06471.1 glycoprotein H [Rhinolophus gammaherpesvirus 1]
MKLKQFKLLIRLSLLICLQICSVIYGSNATSSTPTPPSASPSSPTTPSGNNTQTTNVSITTTAKTLKTTTLRPDPPNGTFNFQEILKKMPMLEINIATNANVIVNWTSMINSVEAASIQKMWVEANMTETLMFTLTKYSDVYKKNDTFKNYTGHFQKHYMCDINNHLVKYNVTANDIKKMVGFNGEFGIPAETIQRDLLSNVNDVIKSEYATHNVFYTKRDYNAYFSVSFLNKTSEMSGYITKDFAYVTVINSSDSGRPKVMTIMLGYTDRLPILKGNLIYNTDFVVAQNEKFSMVLLTSFLHHAAFTVSLTTNYQDLFRRLTEDSPSKVIGRLQTQMVMYEVTGMCPLKDMTPDVFAFILELIFSHFMVVAGLQDVSHYVHMQCFSHFIHELDLLRSLAFTCFHPFYFKGFQSQHLSKVAGQMIVNTPVGSIGSFTHEQRDVVLTMLKLADTIKDVNAKVLWGTAGIIDAIYTTYTNTFTLTDRDRRHLLDIFLLLQDEEKEHKIVNNNNLMLTYLLSSSMCNSAEIATITRLLSKRKDFDIFRTFSPCFMSLRYDFTREKLSSESRLNSNLTHIQTEAGAVGFFNILKDRHVSNFGILPVSSCISHYKSDTLMVIPMFNITYVICTRPISGAINYDVSETFVQKSLVVSAVKSDCHLNTAHTASASRKIPIPIVYNISRSQTECPLCEAAFLSYDERDGLESMMYVTNRIVQHNMFLDNSPFFENQNLHTHYLMLFNNGTVIEIRGRYRERATRMIIAALFIFSFGFGAIFAFKFFLHCC